MKEKKWKKRWVHVPTPFNKSSFTGCGSNRGYSCEMTKLERRNKTGFEDQTNMKKFLNFQ
jgi:hypothetical protein